MKKYQLYLLCLFLLPTLFLFSCSNHDKTVIPPTIPPVTPVDSFFSWHLLNSIGGKGIEDIWFTSSSKGFYLGGDNNIYQSSDSGKTWSKIPGTTIAGGFYQLFFVDAQYGFAQSNNQLEVTRDGGNTWSSKLLPVTDVINISFTSPAEGIFGDLSNLFRTTDTGNTWAPVYSPPISGFGFYPNFINSDTGFVFIGNGTFASSTDSGNSWNQVSQTGLLSYGYAYSTLQFLDAKTGFFAGSNGLLMTKDGNHWNNIYPRVRSDVNNVKFFDANTGYFLSDSVIYKTVNGGLSWSTSCKVINDVFSGMHFINPTTGWACTFKGLIVRIDQ